MLKAILAAATLFFAVIAPASASEPYFDKDGCMEGLIPAMPANFVNRFRHYDDTFVMEGAGWKTVNDTVNQTVRAFELEMVSWTIDDKKKLVEIGKSTVQIEVGPFKSLAGRGLLEILPTNGRWVVVLCKGTKTNEGTYRFGGFEFLVPAN